MAKVFILNLVKKIGTVLRVAFFLTAKFVFWSVIIYFILSVTVKDQDWANSSYAGIFILGLIGLTLSVKAIIRAEQGKKASFGILEFVKDVKDAKKNEKIQKVKKALKKIGTFLLILVLPLMAYCLRGAVDTLKKKEDELSTLERGYSALYKENYNLRYGGSDDKWFEENASTRTGQDENLLRIADEIGLKHIRKTNLRYDETGERILGYYENKQNSGYGDLKNGRPIVVARGLPPEEEKRVLAHEYIHYIYNNSYASNSDQNLFRGLVALLGSQPYLQHRLEPYIRSGTSYIDEILAYSCTEVPDQYMDNYVLGWCNKWIDRSKLKI